MDLSEQPHPIEEIGLSLISPEDGSFATSYKIEFDARFERLYFFRIRFCLDTFPQKWDYT